MSFSLVICHWGLTLVFCITLIFCDSFFTLGLTVLPNHMFENCLETVMHPAYWPKNHCKCCCMFGNCELQYLTSIALFQVRTHSPGINASNGERDLIAIGTSPLAHDLLCLHCIWLLPYGQFLPLFIQFHNSFSNHNLILLHILFCSFIKVCEV